jgi:hypothetical protein
MDRVDGAMTWRNAEAGAGERVIERGNLETPRFHAELADDGDSFAEMHLCELLAANDREAELADRAARTEYYTGTWIEYLVPHGRSEDALAFLRPRVEHGDTLAATPGTVDHQIALNDAHRRATGATHAALYRHRPGPPGARW